MVELFHTPVGACRDDAHAPCHQQAEEPEDGDDDDYAIVFPPCIGDSRSLCRSFHMRPVRYRYGGDCEGMRRVGTALPFPFPNVVGREA